MFESLFQTFTDDANGAMGPERLAALRSAFANAGPAEVEHEAHALAGMAGSYGLAQVEREARMWPRLNRSGSKCASKTKCPTA
jgi:HPt (histidine-containing phosphotransfer) domain-containing protein